jgi:hypothetical protein
MQHDELKSSSMIKSGPAEYSSHVLLVLKLFPLNFILILDITSVDALYESPSPSSIPNI